MYTYEYERIYSKSGFLTAEMRRGIHALRKMSDGRGLSSRAGTGFAG